MDFQFTIGQPVTLKAHVDLYGLARSQPLAIVERHLQECEGGVQRTYLCRVVHPPDLGWRAVRFASFTADVTAGFCKLKESELTALDIEQYKAAIATKEE